MARLINIDNGGTLTDIWVLDENRSYHTKTITTPYDLSKCFFEGLNKVSQQVYGKEDLPALLQSTDHIRYSTTQGTNALVMKKGPKVGLLIGSDTKLDSIASTDKENDMFGVLVDDRVERLDTSLGEGEYKDALLNAVNGLSFKGANRIVVSFEEGNYLEQEARFRHINLLLFPRHLLGAVPVLYAGNLSSDRSFKRRTWTAINNAFLHPAMEQFLFNAENKLRQYRSKNPLLIYRNDGYAGRVAKTVALKTYSSGPRGGMESAREYADYYGFDRCLTMDVGGTTTDIGLITDGKIKASMDGEVEGIACSFSLSDIWSIGVGGGSIIRVSGGVITVGPDSVGGMPGPVCFGLGGKSPTITDALLLLGLIDAKTYFGGEMNLDIERAREVVQEKIANPLAVSLESAVNKMLEAWAISIANGLKSYTDIDENLVLTAFGGGGPMAALAVADAAGINQVLVPRLSAVFSAHGIGFSDIAHSATLRLSAYSQKELEKVYLLLREKVSRDIFSEGFELSECVCDAWLNADGERLDLSVGNPILPSGLNTADDVELSFRAVKTVERAKLPKRLDHDLHPVKPSGYRELTNSNSTTIAVPVVQVEDQMPGAFGEGPAVVEEAFWTCKVDKGWAYEFTTNGDVIFKKNSEAAK